MGPDFDTWQLGIRRTSCRILAGFCLVVAALQGRTLLAPPYELLSTGVTALGVVVLVLVGYRGWRTALGTGDALALTLLVTAAAADPYLVDRQAGAGGDANPAFFLLAATFLVYLVTLRGPAVPVAVTTATSLYVTASVASGGRMLGPVLDEAVILATVQLSVWMLFLQLAHEAVRADAAHRRAIGEQAEAARRTAEQDARVAAQGTLHDRVLAALILVTSNGPDPVAVRAECRRAAQAVATLGDQGPRFDTVVDGDQLRRRLAAEAGVDCAPTGVSVRVSQRDDLRAVLLPAPVAEAFCGAVAEALRNVGRHSGALHAEVAVSVVGDAGVLVEVLDGGRGLPPGFAPGFGLRRSVVARLREVGGEAHIEAVPAGGTRVTLQWQPPPPTTPAPDPTPELARIPAHPRLFASGFAVVLLVGALYLAIRYPTPHGSGGVDALVCLGVIGFIAWCVLTIPRPTVLRHAHRAGFLVLPGLLAVGLYTAGAGGLRGFDSWIVGLCGIPVVLLAMVRPSVPVLALAGLESGVVTVAAALDPTLTPLDVLAPITQTPMFVGLVVYGVGAIARVRRAADAEETALSSALALSQEVAARGEALGSHYDWLRSEVRPFLESVADAVADPDASAVQQRAGVLALAVRDELAVPARLPETMRRHIAHARRRGVRVRVRASDEWSFTTGDSELEELLGLLARDESLTDITLSLLQATTPARVVVRPRLSTLQHSAAVTLLGSRLLDIDEDDLASIITLHPGQPEFA